MSTSLQAPLQESASGLLLTGEEQELMQSTVSAIARAGNFRLESDGTTYPLPFLAARKVVKLLKLMASGEEVEIAPAKSELTVTQAKKFLQTSELHVNDLLDAGKLAFRMIGNERMVLRESLLEFERKFEEANAFLNELLEMDPDDD